jgi:hypothetical protein
MQRRRLQPPPSAEPSADAVRRRDFLRIAGAAGGAALLAGCGGSGPARTPSGRLIGMRFRSRPDLRPPELTMYSHPPGRREMVAGARHTVGRVIVTDTHGQGQQGPLVLDRSGELVWFHPISDRGTPSMRAMNVQVQRYQGLPVLTWWQGSIVSGHGAGHYVVVDESYTPIAQVSAGNGYFGDLHDFQLTADGTALFTCYGQATARIRAHAGAGARHARYWYGVVQEVDVATGKVLFQWRSDHHVGFGASYHLPPPADPSVPWDYFHINSIAVDPVDGHLWISSRNTWTVYKVHRRSGRIIWRLGGRHSDFTMGPRTHFAFAHHVTPHPGGLVTIFDNEAGPPHEAGQSRALLLRLDERRRRATFIREYHHRPPVLAQALGSVQEAGHGHVFVGWGDPAWFSEFDAAGRVVLDARLERGVVSYRAFEASWKGRPTTTPALTHRRVDSRLLLYASWNGATEHRRWRVLGGDDPATMTERQLVSVRGFETEIAIRNPTAWLGVEAVGGDGQVLGRSPNIRI